MIARFIKDQCTLDRADWRWLDVSPSTWARRWRVS